MSPSLEDPIQIYAIGTAGSGKTRFTAGIRRHLLQAGHDAVLVNLDPGAERLPYDPDVDVRDWIVLADVMDEYDLGPNGAQVIAADLLALRAGEVKEAIEDFRADYVVLDTPGQTELFVFREAGRILLDVLGRERAVFAFLIDPFLARRPSAFVSQLMLAATTNFRFGVPQMNVLTKVDLVSEADVERLQAWAATPEELMTALLEEQSDMFVQLNTDVAKVLEGMGGNSVLFPVSSESLDGFDEVAAQAQRIALGGEDLESGREG